MLKNLICKRFGISPLKHKIFLAETELEIVTSGNCGKKLFEWNVSFGSKIIVKNLQQIQEEASRQQPIAPTENWFDALLDNEEVDDQPGNFFGAIHSPGLRPKYDDY